MTPLAWVFIIAWSLTVIVANYYHYALLRERGWIDALLEDPKATLQALVEMEENE